MHMRYVMHIADIVFGKLEHDGKHTDCWSSTSVAVLLPLVALPQRKPTIFVKKGHNFPPY